MKCLKCGRPIPDKEKKCIYCGASLDGRSPSKINHNADKDGNIIILDVHYETEMFQDLPEQARHMFEDALGEEKETVIAKEESTIVQDSLGLEKEENVTASLGAVLTLLSKMKSSLESGNIGNREYNRMTFNIIKDYISTLPDDMQLNFVVHEIRDSELSGFINEGILKDLRAFVLSSKAK
jgi:hypothetical protein